MAARPPRRTFADLMVRLLAPLIALALAILLPTSAQAAPFSPAGAIVVNSTADTGKRCDDPTATECTLRGAISTANARAGEDTITFSLLGGAKLTPATPLPAFTQTVTIDGTGPTGAPQIEIDGSLIKENVTAAAAALKGAVAEPLEQPKAQATRSSTDGVIRFLRPWGLDFKDADNSTIRGLIVHSFPYAQIGFDGTDGATVKGNWLGLKPDGSVSERRSTEDRMIGLALINSAVNLIGGPNAEKNIISGTEIGLVLMDRGASGNLIYGNYIGTTTDGRGERANTETGILLTEPANLAGRGTEQNRIVGNVVLGKREDSYGISVLAAKETDIWGNFVGLSAAGLAESPTGEPLGHDIGISVHDSPDTAIGGTGPAEFNLVAGNDLGIELNGGSDRSTIAGNLVGTEYGGKTATVTSANRYGVGVVADGLGEAPADVTINENTVANTGEQGMYVTGAAKRVTVTANRFGTDVDGVGKLPNKIGFATGQPASGGDAPSDLTFGPGNVAAGNSIDGVRVLDGTNMVVRGNRIGVSADGKPLGNGTVGLNVQADGTLVENNTVSANAQGIAVNGPTDNAIIRANRIGTAPTGEPTPQQDFGNAGAGVLVLGTATDTRIGGSSSTDGNVISGNGRGVHVAGDANGTTIRQNVIGLNTTADAAIPNDVGVYLAGGRHTVVGGALGIDARNYIARNYEAGVRINGAKQSVIMGNYITDNRGPGVLADGKGGDAVIGYDAETDGTIEDRDCRETRCNRIENNQGAGVRLEAKAQVTVRGNRMRGNTGLDVDLAEPGATANDDNDGDEFPNTPTGVLALEAPDRIAGQLDRFDADQTLIDVYGFSSTEALKGRPRGGELIGTTFPDARGEWALETSRTYAAYGAVMTDRHGNTSEMSPSCTGDQDGDALCDNWETGGIDYDADGTPDLRLQDQGASPVKPDVFVEVDWQAGRKPHLRALYDVKQAFELAPKPIALHTAMGEEVPGSSAINADGRSIGRDNDVQDFLGGESGSDPCRGAFGSRDEREDEDCFRILGARKLAYRYAIFAGSEQGGYSGAADPGGDAFLVTLGAFPREDILLGGGSGEQGCNRQYDACLAQLESAVFMHELGHTLGLLHGGDKTGENHEPNYLSVMNYWYLTRVPLNDRPLDFSRKTPIARNEAGFDEGLPLYEDYPQRAEHPWTEAAITAYDAAKDECRLQRVRLNQKIDLNGDGEYSTRAMGLNDVDVDHDANALEDCQKAENHTWLTGTDDWSRLRFARHGLAGWDEGHYDPDAGEGKADEPKPTQLAKAIDSDGDGLDDDEDVCPAAADPDQKDTDADGLGDACLPFITQRDVALTLTAASANLPAGETRTVTLEASNTYARPATGVVVAITPPAGVTVDTPRWEVGEIPVRGSKTLDLKLTGTAVGRGALTAEVIAAAEPDFDSTPDNHDAAEDDQVSKRLTVFQPGAVPTISIVAKAVREADERTETTQVRINLDVATGMAVEGRLRSVGGTATPGEDYTPVDAPVSIENSQSDYVDLVLHGDTDAEADETIELELSGVDGAQPETLRGVITISDDDAPRKPGELAYLGCVSRDYGPGESCDQREPKLAAPGGEKALTPDGRFLWVAAEAALVRLTRDPATGALGSAKCWALSGPANGCASLGETNVEPYDVLITPDGKQLVVAGANRDEPQPVMAMLSLALDANGEPTLTGCAGRGALDCTATQRGSEPIVSPGGRYLITAPEGQTTSHGPIQLYPLYNGKLEPVERCYQHPGENRPCEPLNVNLDSATWMAFSPDGKTLAVRTRDHLALLGWDEATGTLSQDGGCLLEDGACQPATKCTMNSGREFKCPTPPDYLSGWGPVRFAPDGRALYVGSQRGNRVTALPRVADRTWSFDASMCAGRRSEGCELKTDVVDKATEIVTSPDGGDVYVTGPGGGVLSMRADPRTGALSAPRCTLTGLGLPACPEAIFGSAVVTGTDGNMVFDPTGRDLYTTEALVKNRYGIARFLRTSRPPEGQNRAPLCTGADAAVRPGETVELTLRCADPDGDPVTLRKTRGGGELAGTRLKYTAGTTAGVETVGFRATDTGGLESAEAEVRVTVGRPPACADGAVSVLRRGSVALPMSCDRGTVEIVEHPAHGGVVGTTFNASPQGHDGVEHVRYAAYDPDTGVRSNVATITVTVLAPPPGPDVIEFGEVKLENDRGGANNGCSGSSCRPSGGGELPFPMRCNGSPTQTPGSCSGTLEACTPSGCSKRAGGTKASAAAAKLKGSLGKAKFTIPVGQAKTVKLRLNAKARTALAKQGRLKLRIVTTVKLPTGKTVTSTRTLTVKKPLPKKRKVRR